MWPDFIVCISFFYILKSFLPLLAWFGGLALKCAGLSLLELGWSLLGCGGASGSDCGQGASCRGAAVHFGWGWLKDRRHFQNGVITHVFPQRSQPPLCVPLLILFPPSSQCQSVEIMQISWNSQISSNPTLICSRLIALLKQQGRYVQPLLLTWNVYISWCLVIIY